MAVMVVQFALPSLKDGTPGLGMPVGARGGAGEGRGKGRVWLYVLLRVYVAWLGRKGMACSHLTPFSRVPVHHLVFPCLPFAFAFFDLLSVAAG